MAAAFSRNGNWFAAGYNICACLFGIVDGVPLWLILANAACAIFSTAVAIGLGRQISRGSR